MKTSMTIEITTLISMAESAASGMTDYENVEAHEDARTAAEEIVAYWENETGLLGQRETDRFAQLGGTDADMDEIRGRCVDIIERAILADRTKGVRCECGAWSGERCEWIGPASETVTVEWMPEQHRDSHAAADNRGVWPHNGARRLQCERSCADRILSDAGDWARIV